MNKKYMQLALELARKGHTSPNPKVGCVIVKDNKIIAQGYHQQAGKPHAEVEALSKLNYKANNATMYVTLEPCCHENKRTPPCINQIINSGIKEVIVASNDPNPKVNGRGIAALKKAGIKVSVGLMEKEAIRLNESYAKWIITKKPFVILKLATTLDGKISKLHANKNGNDKWISNGLSRRYVHELRNEVDAVLVGINTVLCDDPKLTCRLKGIKNIASHKSLSVKIKLVHYIHNPLRIILDSTLKIPLEAQVLKDNNVLIATTNNADKQKLHQLKSRRIKVLIFNDIKVNDMKDNLKIPLDKLMTELGKNEITSVMIEGGADVATESLKQSVVDKVIWFIAPKIFGEGKSAIINLDSIRDVVQLRNVTIKQFGEDVCVEGYLH